MLKEAAFDTGAGQAVEGMYRYDAFICYRRLDGTPAAEGLRHRLIDYRLPKGFPQRSLRIYLDRIYEHATEDFFVNTIQPALASSKALIVVQTPAAAATGDDGQDTWVAREVCHFRGLPQRDNIWVALAVGDFADPLPAGLDRELPNVERVDIRPLAGAWRRLSEHELLKFVGPLHGVPTHRMPDLRRESERRSRARSILWTTAGLAIIAVLTTLSVIAFLSAQRATAQQHLAERRLADSESRELASRADALLAVDFPLALSTAASAVQRAPTSEALNTTLKALSANPFLVKVGFTSDHPLRTIVAAGSGVLAGGGRGTLLSWDTSGPATPVSMRLPDAEDVVALAALENGEALVAGGTQIRHLPAASAEPKGVALDVGGTVRSIAIYHTILAVGYVDGSAQVWDWRRRTTLTPRWKASSAQVVALRFSPDGKELATIGGSEVKLWDWARTRVIRQLRVVEGAKVWSLAFHPRKPVVAFGDDRGVIRLWSFLEGAGVRQYRALDQEGRVARCLSFAADGTALVAGFEDGTVLALDDALEPLLGPVTTVHRSAVQDVAFVAATRFVSAGYDGRLALWDLQAPSRLTQNVTALASQAEAWGASEDGAVNIVENQGDRYALRTLTYGARSSTPVGTLAATTVAVDLRRGTDAYVAIGSDGGLVGTVSGRPFQLAAGSISLSLEHPVVGLDVAELAVAVATEHETAAWSLSGEVIIQRRELQMNGYPTRVELASSGRVILVLDKGGSLHVVPASSAAPVRMINQRGLPINDFRLIDDHHVVTAGPGRGVSIWSLDNLQRDSEPLAFPGHGDAISRIALSADRTLLAAGDVRGRIMMWEVGNPAGRLAPFDAWGASSQQSWVSDLLYTPSGYLYSRYGSGTVLALDLDERRWVRLACDTSGSSTLRANGSKIADPCGSVGYVSSR
jgi:WD40 repeat protein